MKIRNFAFLFLFCALPSLCYGQIYITEIMYDPAGADYGHEWIEVYNASSTNVALSKYKIVENGARHNIIAAGNSELVPGSYAVIAQNAADFQKDYPTFSGELFHSAISLDNAGATIQIIDASSSVIASATYDSTAGALGDGNSLQRSSDDDLFVARAPSPGAMISSSAIPAKTKNTTAEKSPKQATSTAKNMHASSFAYSDDSKQTPTATRVATSEVAAVDIPDSSDSYVWWMGAAALASASAAALFFAKRYKKHEWNIIEES